MKITLTSTKLITHLDGRLVRLWEGVTEGGVACKAYVALIAVADHDDTAEFDRELHETLEPGAQVPFRQTLDPGVN